MCLLNYVIIMLKESKLSLKHLNHSLLSDQHRSLARALVIHKRFPSQFQSKVFLFLHVLSVPVISV